MVEPLPLLPVVSDVTDFRFDFLCFLPVVLVPMSPVVSPDFAPRSEVPLLPPWPLFRFGHSGQRCRTARYMSGSIAALGNAVKKSFFMGVPPCHLGRLGAGLPRSPLNGRGLRTFSSRMFQLGNIPEFQGDSNVVT